MANQRFSWHKFVEGLKKRSHIYLILLIEISTCLAMAIVIGVGGWLSTPNISRGVCQFFITVLSGWGFTCDILAALLWGQALKQSAPEMPISWLGRALDQYHVLRYVLYLVPLALDTATSVAWVYAPHRPGLLLNLTPVLIFFLQLVVGSNFLVQSVRFQTHAKLIEEQARKTRSATSGPSMDMFLSRLSKWTFCLALAKLLHIAVLPIGATMFLFTHIGWALFWSVEMTTRSLTSLCHIMMAKPKPFRPAIVTTKDVMVQNANAT
ncbi:Uncharacterized protein PBTT_01310 [Plasmodiophora brassicae]|uniref:Uncharacterized protein n=1 Tax=Plasmodiophora brassicae TaxID=37360 RepID=A0A0G4IYI7_PLABS|nr:hypothetical protein PBRA_001482 [Plasmodiophora brassicae]